MSLEQLPPPPHLSYSQLSSYSDCSERYRLERLHRVESGTWWTTLMGSTIHAVSEDVDRQRWLGIDVEVDCKELFMRDFEERVKNCTEEIKASGKALANVSESGGPDKKDRKWAEHYGPIYLERYFAWSEVNGLKIATIGGLPGIEVPFDFEIVNTDGEVIQLRGAIDRVYTRFGRVGLTVVDLKTGRVPPGSLQLATYGVALKVAHDVDAREGMFWAPTLGATGRGRNRHPSPTGGTSEPVDLRLWDVNLLSTAYFAARRGIDNNVFIPHITDLCRGCGVRDYCWGWSGSAALPPNVKKEAE